MKPALEFKIVWKDETEDLLELRVSATNGNFSGAAKLYTQHGVGKRIAREIEGFPKSPKDVRVIEIGTFDPQIAGGGIKLRLFCTDGSGHSEMEVRIQSKFGHREESSFLAKIESVAIDDFVNQLAAWGDRVGDDAYLRDAT